MLRSLATVSGFTFLSRVLGLLREMLIANFLGTSIVTDAFYAALRLPNMFRRIFGEGAFNSAFVPLFNRDLSEGGPERAERFARLAFSWLAVVLVAGTLIAIVGMPWFARLLVPKFGPEAYELTVAYGRIMFAYLLCMALSAHLSGVLNSLQIFAMPAFAPVLLNVFLLVGLAVIVPLAQMQGRLGEIGELASWCVMASGFAQLLLLWITCWRRGMRIGFVRPRWSPKMKRLARLMGPGVAAAGVQQINLLIGTQIASSQQSAVGYLGFGERLFQLPMGLIGAAFGVVLLPEITRLVRANDDLGASESIGRGVVFSMLLTLPAAAALIAVPEAFVKVMFERGQFDAVSTAAVAPTVAAFSLGLPAYVLVKVLQAGYFARENTRLPMKIAVVTVLVNVVFSLTLFPFMRHVGIALATSIAGWVNVILLLRGLKGQLGVDRQRVGKLLKITLAAALMAGGVVFAAAVMAPWFAGAEWQKWSAILLLVGVGASFYGVAVLLLRATSVAELREGFRR